MGKGHREAEVGPWAEDKLTRLEAYLRYYQTVLKKQTFWHKVYIDAFAGAVSPLVRRSNGLGPTTQQFLDIGEEDATQAERYIAGSPSRALSISPAFDHLIFCDMDQARADALDGLSAKHPSRSIEVLVGDANELLIGAINRLPRDHKGIAFLDPYGAHLAMDTVRNIGRSGNIEVLINFPLHMAIMRLIPRDGVQPHAWGTMLDRCFGTDEWRKLVDRPADSLFGDILSERNMDLARDLLALYCAQLKLVFKHVSDPCLVRGTKNNPLYYLIWAGPHPAGLRGAQYILGKPRK